MMRVLIWVTERVTRRIPLTFQRDTSGGRLDMILRDSLI